LPAKLLQDLSCQMPHQSEMAAKVLDVLRERGFDGIIYGNVIEGSCAIPPYEPTAICFSPTQMEVLSVESHSVQPVLA
jgi:hypothetical protein